MTLVLFPKHDEVLLDFGSLIVQLPRLLLHLEQIVIELSVEIVVLLSYGSHLLLKIVHEAEELGVLFITACAWLLLVLALMILRQASCSAYIAVDLPLLRGISSSMLLL